MFTINVRNTCTISCLAFELITPFETALCTLPEKLSNSGITKFLCQSSAAVVTVPSAWAKRVDQPLTVRDTTSVYKYLDS